MSTIVPPSRKMMFISRIYMPLAALASVVLSLPGGGQKGKRSTDKTDEYDYLIVGAGPAGFVLAEKLSRDPSISVVLLEAGPDVSQLNDVIIPGLETNNEPSTHTWNYNVVPQKSLGRLTPALSQGKALGGGSAINAMNYNRGDKSIFDDWAIVSGNDGLRWDNLLKDFRATVRFINDTQLTYSQVIDYEAYGHGPLKITRDLQPDGFDPSWHDALISKLDLPEVDFNSGAGQGVSYDVYSIAPNRTRSYALTAFGYPMAGRANARIVHDATVSKVNFEGTRASGITYVDGRNRTRTLRGKEVILSAGAIGSPKLLLLSGVGPARQLRALRIPLVLDCPAVGSNLRDHNWASMEVQVVPDVYTLSRWQNGSYLNDLLTRYGRSSDGPLADCPSGSFAVVRAPDSALPEGAAGTWHRDLPPGRGQLMMQYGSLEVLGDAPASLPVVSAWVALTQPEASGSVRLRSADFRDEPLIDTAYFGSRGDRAAMLWGYRRLREVLGAPELAGVVVREIFPGANVTSDRDLWRAIRTSAASYRHPTGTVALGSVLDADFRVKGLRGLRVVDSSTFPSPPNVHTQADVYAVARMAARQILRADRRSR